MGVVVKIGGIPWFNAMEVGIKARAKELGWDAWMVGPTSADPALRVRAVEDLIAQGVDAIGVVPNDAEVLEPVLARAREQGILVITHESPDQKNVDWNFELASSTGFGKVHVLGPFSPGQGRRLVHDGVLTGGFMWNPMEAGRVFVTMADHLKKGMAVEKGTMIDGLGEVDPDFETKNIIVALNKDTVDGLAEMGL